MHRHWSELVPGRGRTPRRRWPRTSVCTRASAASSQQAVAAGRPTVNRSVTSEQQVTDRLGAAARAQEWARTAPGLHGAGCEGRSGEQVAEALLVAAEVQHQLDG